MTTVDTLTRVRPPAEGAIASGRLDWPGASPEQLAFMRAVYDRQAALSRAAGGTFTADLPDGRLGVIYGRHQARTDAAAAARALLAAARTALAAAGLADRVRIGIVSAYRPASRQFVIWQGRGREGGFPYYYRQMLRRGALRSGDYGPAAVLAMAREMANWIAAPGYSNHQDGLAIDFGTGAAGRGGLGVIGTRSWFHQWLVGNAQRFGFHPYRKEAWHWTYRPGSGTGTESEAGTPSRALIVPRVPLLASHRGVPPDLVLRWNVSAVPEVIDVVVHLHGFWYDGMRLDRDIERVSGLDLAPARTRPTLTLLPRGDNTGVKQKTGSYTAFTFPALVTRNGIPELVRFALDRFAAQVGGAPPRLGRLILTAHSGGGAALLKSLRFCDPHQVHVFDALYQDAGALADWASGRIRRDRAALATVDPAAARRYMAERGGALRVFYQDRLARGTRPFSLELARRISAGLGPELAPWYRVEASRYDHFQIPSRYGWRLLADASADVPDAYREKTAPHTAAADFSRRTPAGRRYAALVPLLDRYRGDIPLDFLLGWIDVESNGRIDVITSIDERGFFQIHPDESRDRRFEHERLTTDPDYSVRAGIQLVRTYIDLARKRFPWVPAGSELFWRLVKLQHAMGSGLAQKMLSDMRSNGVPPTTWDAIKAYEPTAAAQRLHRLLRVKPGRFARNVDAVFTQGRRIAASVGR